MIGLVDFDLQTATSVNLSYPNLEIMKIATYYRNEENKFCRLVGLDETELEGYEKIYFFSENFNNKIIPPQFLKSKNINFGGAGFTNGQYIPFVNSVIDYTLPKPIIYKDFLKEKYTDGVKTSVINHILDDSYYRIKAGDSLLPRPVIRKNKRLFIFDNGIFYDGWENIFDRISEKQPSQIICIHPIICKTITQFFNLRKLPKLSRTNEIILDTDIPLDDANYMLNKYGNMFLADIVPSSNVFLPIGGNFNTGNQYYRDLVYKLNLLYYFWSKGILIKIKYIKPKIGVINPIENLELLIEKWACGRTKFEKTIQDRIRKPKNKQDIVIEEAEKKKVLSFHPKAERLFHECFNSVLGRY